MNTEKPGSQDRPHDRNERLAIDVAGTPEAAYGMLLDAVDLASGQDRRTALTSDGKVIAAIVTAEDLGRLEALDGNVPHTVSGPGGVISELDSILAALTGPANAGARLAEAADRLRVLRGKLAFGTRPAGPDMADRLGQVLSGLIREGSVSGFAIGVPFSTGYEPAGIAEWLRHG